MRLPLNPLYAALMALALITSGTPTTGQQGIDPLLFPKENYTTDTLQVLTAAGERTVVAHTYQHLLYVANPVDSAYQSLDVQVPVSIDGVAVDASQAPILFYIAVGGYLSVRNVPDAKAQKEGPPRPNRPLPGANNNSNLALAKGFVVVSPGCRGRDNQRADGTFYGKAPAAIVDLKAAVRYLRHNSGVVPGNTDHIVSVGCSAGGALSALLGASGNSPLYAPYLQEIGAAEERDDIFGSGCYSPITDLDHADMAYEWMYGNLPTRSGMVDQALSQTLKTEYAAYQQSLHLQGKNGFGMLTADNYADYLLHFYLFPSASFYLKSLSTGTRKAYLTQNPWLKWSGDSASFTFADYAKQVSRLKWLPAFDDFESRATEPDLFGTENQAARHFTDFSLRHGTHDPEAEVERELKTVVNMMNAMYFLGNKNESCASNWWLRTGSSDNHTSQTVIINLATTLENQGKSVNTWLFWEGGHCADDDPEGFLDWMGKVSGYRE